MFKRLGRLTTTHPWLVCAAWVVVGAVLTVHAPAWDTKTQDDDIRFLPVRCASVRGYHLLEKAFPQEVFASRAIFAVERALGPLRPSDFALVDGFVRDLDQLRREEPELQIIKVTSYSDPIIGSRLTSGDRCCTLIQVALGTPFLALQTRATVDRAEARLGQRLAGAGADTPCLLTTGPAGIGRDLIRASADSLDSTTLATVVLVIVVLLLVYRAPLLAFVPLATIAVSVWVALELLALLTLVPGVHLVNVSKVFAIVILYGAGTDYCLFLISRYQEYLAGGHSLTRAISRSVWKVGSTLAASAGTVICGLGLMGCAEFAKVRCAGPAIALSLAVALLASVTLAPALLQVLGRAVFWPSRMPAPGSEIYSRGLRGPAQAKHDPLWDRISRGVVARPALVCCTAALAMVPLALLGLLVNPDYKPTGQLAPTSSSVQGVAVVQKHFTAGEIGPVTVLLVSGTDWSTPEGREVVAHLSQGFGRLANVAEVRSLTQPLGRPVQRPPSLGRGASKQVQGTVSRGLFRGLLESIEGDLNQALARGSDLARQFYLAALPAENGSPRYATRLDVVLGSDPFGSASMVTLEEIQYWLREHLPPLVRHLGGAQAECYGVTVNARDLAEVTEADRARVNALVLAGIFVILLVLLRRPWLAGYLLITVLFSYYATLGATALMGTIWSARPLGQLDWRVPFFLFTILVAVGEDYNIFLMTRILQERRQHGAKEGTRRALAHTGATITSCGLIMAGTFATLTLSGLGTLMQIGFALAFGVLLDTFIVRPFLVPAFTLLVWTWAGQRRETSQQGKAKILPRRILVPSRRRVAWPRSA